VKVIKGSMSNQTPYIGSKISLISKLDIRYEGILYTVDSAESTIALAKVRSFGTEDRPTPTPVAARDEVYEYVVFQASDIKDLIVCEQPKKAPVSTLPYDPAIISVSQKPMEPRAPIDAVAPSGGSSGSNTPQQAPMSRAPGAGRANNRPPQRNSFQERGDYGAYPQQSRNAPRQGGWQDGPRNNYRSGGNYNRDAGHAQRTNPRPPTNSYRPAPPKDKLKFDSDYDFEKANEQFQETLGQITEGVDNITVSVEKEQSDDNVSPTENLSQSPTEKADNYYNKSASFFDSISCEALEKEEGKSTRPDWRKERMTNQETFGHSAVRSLAYRRGGRSYGPRPANQPPRGNQHRYNNSYNGAGGGGGNGMGYNRAPSYSQNRRPYRTEY
jgi:protein LSM14